MDVAAATRAAQQVCRLAEEHARDLDPFVTAAVKGLRGPAGRRLLDDVRGQRQALHRALDAAWREVADAARRAAADAEPSPLSLLPPPGAGTLRDAAMGPPPYLPSLQVDAPSGSGSLRGIDENVLRQAIRTARTSGDALCDAGRGLAQIMSRVPVDPSPGRQVTAIGDWLLGQQYELRRRIDLARAADAAIGDMFGAAVGGPLDQRLEQLAPAELAAMIALREIIALKAGSERAAKTSTWWKSLSQSTRDRLIKLFPGTVGALDGVPSRDRDTANRLVLNAEKARLDALMEKARKLESDLDGVATHDPDYHHLEQQLAGIEALQATLRAGDTRVKAGGEPPVLLLGFDTQDLGKAIVSFDNPDTADHVVTFVPGFGTTQAGTRDNLVRAASLWDQAHALAHGQSTASIYWFDYRPPQVGNLHRTMFEGLADQAVQPLGGFMRGLEASRIAPEPAHTTILAHSYGSLAAGKTAVEFPRLADNLILLGSPGVGVDHARDLIVDPDGVWVGAADNDPVANWLPPRDPLELLEAGPTPDLIFGEDGPFGTKPISPDFGAQRFYTEPRGHTRYWDGFSKSMKNLGHITVGQDPVER